MGAGQNKMGFVGGRGSRGVGATLQSYIYNNLKIVTPM